MRRRKLSYATENGALSEKAPGFTIGDVVGRKMVQSGSANIEIRIAVVIDTGGEGFGCWDM